jgi:hypothetical protein
MNRFCSAKICFRTRRAPADNPHWITPQHPVKLPIWANGSADRPTVWNNAVSVARDFVAMLDLEAYTHFAFMGRMYLISEPNCGRLDELSAEPLDEADDEARRDKPPAIPRRGRVGFRREVSSGPVLQSVGGSRSAFPDPPPPDVISTRECRPCDLPRCR